MKNKTRVFAQVEAVDSENDPVAFDLERSLDGSFSTTADIEKGLLGVVFMGEMEDGQTRQFTVSKILKWKILPELIFINPRGRSIERAFGVVRLGDYDDPDDWMVERRKSILTGLRVEFEVNQGEGIVFNGRDRYGSIDGPYSLRWTKKHYLIEGCGEEWIFAKPEWESHVLSQQDIDYIKADDFRNSLPELRS